jgi:hypothetical protein
MCAGISANTKESTRTMHVRAVGRLQGSLETIQAAQAEGRDITDEELAELHQQLGANSQTIAGWDAVGR